MTYFPPQLPTQPVRAIETAYQPNANRPTEVSVDVNISLITAQSAIVQFLCDAANPPTTVIGQGQADDAPAAGTVNHTLPFTRTVPAGYYYKITKSSGGGTTTITKTNELTR